MTETKHCTLYHFPLCPFSRTVRLCLFEKNISYVLVFEKTWERRIDFLRLNPAGTVPVFEDEDGTILSDYRSICEYLNETRVGLELFGDNPKFRAEVRRLLGWFDMLFYPEVYQTLVVNKALKKLQDGTEPNATLIRIGRQNLKRHLNYFWHSQYSLLLYCLPSDLLRFLFHGRLWNTSLREYPLMIG